MKVVKVYGALRELLGRTRFEFVADTPAQAMRALLVNFPELQQWLIDSEKNGVAYRVTVGKQKIHNDDVSGLFSPWSEREVFSITPVVTGAGRGAGMILMGAVLIGLSFVTFGGSAAFAGGAGGLFAKGGVGLLGMYAGAGSAALGALGFGLVLTGVAQMLSPVPKPPGIGEAPTQLESNSFSGVENTSRQGVPVPIVYGRVFVGSAVISAGLDVDQV
jgi:predicted phage tail protein